MAKKKNKEDVSITSVKVSKLDSDFLFGTGRKFLSSASEFCIRTYRLLFYNTLPELKGKFSYRELLSLVEIQKYVDDVSLSTVGAVGWWNTILLIEQQQKILEKNDIEQSGLSQKLLGLTAGQTLVLQEVLDTFIRTGKEDFKEYISIIL